MSKKGKVSYNNLFAGIIEENDEGYFFTYDSEYLKLPNKKPISLTMSLQKDQFKSKTMFPFFDGLIPEGWLLDIAQENWKIDLRDRMGLLLSFCKDCIGAVSVTPLEEENE